MDGLDYILVTDIRFVTFLYIRSVLLGCVLAVDPLYLVRAGA